MLTLDLDYPLTKALTFLLSSPIDAVPSLALRFDNGALMRADDGSYILGW